MAKDNLDPDNWKAVRKIGVSYWADMIRAHLPSKPTPIEELPYDDNCERCAIRMPHKHGD